MTGTRYVPVDEGGGNERCENCRERASAHLCPPGDHKRKATMTEGHHHRLSTHLIRRTARSAQRHYEQLQLEADMEGPAGEYARTACARLHIGLMDAIVVRKALYERGKWVVVAEGA